MNNTKKIAIGIGIAGGALLAAWLLTGDRKKKTKDFLARKVQDLKQTLNNGKTTEDESDIHYV
jgi:hypothetical protein